MAASMRVLYLHGFGSSASSSKATFFGKNLREEAGITLETPDLNEPDFSTLTVTRMVDRVVRMLDATPDADRTVLIGSSLGAFVAVQLAVARPDLVHGLILLAPALDFSDSGLRGPGGADVAEWKRTGSLSVFHFGYGRMMPIHYGLYEDARRYNPMHARIDMPTLVFQGRSDTAVDPVTVEEWSRARPNVELHMLDDDHQLTASVEYIWGKIGRFLGIGGARDHRGR
jgi:pimeloyl-ACP methyl ester carboxylesterase